MIIDSRMVFFDAANIADGDELTGTIDLYGEDIDIYPNSNLSHENGRGKGSALYIHLTIAPDASSLGGTNPLGHLFMGNTDPATEKVVDVEMPTLGDTVYAGRNGIHYVFAIPVTAEGRYITYTLDLLGLTGLGPDAKATAFIFAA